MHNKHMCIYMYKTGNALKITAEYYVPIVKINIKCEVVCLRSRVL